MSLSKQDKNYLVTAQDKLVNQNSGIESGESQDKVVIGSLYLLDIPYKKSLDPLHMDIFCYEEELRRLYGESVIRPNQEVGIYISSSVDGDRLSTNNGRLIIKNGSTERANLSLIPIRGYTWGNSCGPDFNIWARDRHGSTTSEINGSTSFTFGETTKKLKIKIDDEVEGQIDLSDLYVFPVTLDAAPLASSIQVLFQRKGDPNYFVEVIGEAVGVSEVGGETDFVLNHIPSINNENKLILYVNEQPIPETDYEISGANINLKTGIAVITEILIDPAIGGEQDFNLAHKQISNLVVRKNSIVISSIFYVLDSINGSLHLNYELAEGDNVIVDYEYSAALKLNYGYVQVNEDLFKENITYVEDPKTKAITEIPGRSKGGEKKFKLEHKNVSNVILTLNGVRYPETTTNKEGIVTINWIVDFENGIIELKDNKPPVQPIVQFLPEGTFLSVDYQYVSSVTGDALTADYKYSIFQHEKFLTVSMGWNPSIKTFTFTAGSVGPTSKITVMNASESDFRNIIGFSSEQYEIVGKYANNLLKVKINEVEKEIKVTDLRVCDDGGVRGKNNDEIGMFWSGTGEPGYIGAKKVGPLFCAIGGNGKDVAASIQAGLREIGTGGFKDAECLYFSEDNTFIIYSGTFGVPSSVVVLPASDTLRDIRSIIGMDPWWQVRGDEEYYEYLGGSVPPGLNTKLNTINGITSELIGPATRLSHSILYNIVRTIDNINIYDFKYPLMTTKVYDDASRGKQPLYPNGKLIVDSTNNMINLVDTNLDTTSDTGKLTIVDEFLVNPANGGETVFFTKKDDISDVELFKNGVKLVNSDYVFTTTSSIGKGSIDLTTPLVASDILMVNYKAIMNQNNNEVVIEIPSGEYSEGELASAIQDAIFDTIDDDEEAPKYAVEFKKGKFKFWRKGKTKFKLLWNSGKDAYRSIGYFLGFNINKDTGSAYKIQSDYKVSFSNTDFSAISFPGQFYSINGQQSLLVGGIPLKLPLVRNKYVDEYSSSISEEKYVKSEKDSAILNNIKNLATYDNEILLRSWESTQIYQLERAIQEYEAIQAQLGAYTNHIAESDPETTKKLAALNSLRPNYDNLKDLRGDGISIDHGSLINIKQKTQIFPASEGTSVPMKIDADPGKIVYNNPAPIVRYVGEAQHIPGIWWPTGLFRSSAEYSPHGQPVLEVKGKSTSIPGYTCSGIKSGTYNIQSFDTNAIMVGFNFGPYTFVALNSLDLRVDGVSYSIIFSVAVINEILMDQAEGGEQDFDLAHKQISNLVVRKNSIVISSYVLDSVNGSIQLDSPLDEDDNLIVDYAYSAAMTAQNVVNSINMAGAGITGFVEGGRVKLTTLSQKGDISKIEILGGNAAAIIGLSGFKIGINGRGALKVDINGITTQPPIILNSVSSQPGVYVAQDIQAKLYPLFDNALCYFSENTKYFDFTNRLKITSPRQTTHNFAVSDRTIVIDNSNNKLDFQESAGVNKVATIPNGFYSQSTLSLAIKNALEDAGGSTYSTSLVGNKIQVSSNLAGSGGIFSLMFYSGPNAGNGISNLLGFFKLDRVGLSFYIGDGDVKDRNIWEELKFDTQVIELGHVITSVKASLDDNIFSTTIGWTSPTPGSRADLEIDITGKTIEYLKSSLNDYPEDLYSAQYVAGTTNSSVYLLSKMAEMYRVEDGDTLNFKVNNGAIQPVIFSCKKATITSGYNPGILVEPTKCSLIIKLSDVEKTFSLCDSPTDVLISGEEIATTIQRKVRTGTFTDSTAEILIDPAIGGEQDFNLAHKQISNLVVKKNSIVMPHTLYVLDSVNGSLHLNSPLVEDDDLRVNYEYSAAKGASELFTCVYEKGRYKLSSGIGGNNSKIEIGVAGANNVAPILKLSGSSEISGSFCANSEQVTTAEIVNHINNNTTYDTIEASGILFFFQSSYLKIKNVSDDTDAKLEVASNNDETLKRFGLDNNNVSEASYFNSSSCSSLLEFSDKEIKNPPASYVMNKGYDNKAIEIVYYQMDTWGVDERIGIIDARCSYQFAKRREQITTRADAIKLLITNDVVYKPRREYATMRLNKKTGSYYKIGEKFNQQENNEATKVTNSTTIEEINKLL